MCIYNVEWGKSFENSEFGMRNSEFGVWMGKYNELGEEQLAPFAVRSVKLLVMEQVLCQRNNVYCKVVLVAEKKSNHK